MRVMFDVLFYVLALTVFSMLGLSELTVDAFVIDCNDNFNEYRNDYVVSIKFM